MASFISVPLKKSSEVDLVKPLAKFVAAAYPAGGEEQAEHLRAVDELNKLRRSALGRPLDRYESSLELLLRYFDQMSAVEPKFPFSENQLCLTFTWKDAFDRGSLFGGSVKLALASLGYEKTCVLFNAAALASQIASEQNLDSDEGLKAAAKYYQLASGAFGHIKDTVMSALNREPTMDISPDTVGALHHIMLAQAQEVFFLKATSDKMKEAIIAKLANQAADFYDDAYKQCQYRENLPKEVLPVLAAKRYIMQANAELYQSMLAKQKKRFGEEIARLQHAAHLVKTVEYVSVKDLSDKINRALANAKKDNDFIYHDRVPEVKDLDNIGKAALAKPTAISPPLSQKFTDLFEKMVPMAVQQSMSVYSQRKAETVNRLVGNMREATNLCNGVLASLNLPAALEDLSGDSIPQSIVEKSRAIVGKGGLQSIEQMIRDLPEHMTRNREILDESLKMLDDEETTDNELRSKFNQRWNRTPSGDLYKSLRAEGANFRSKLDVATQADQVVRERFNTHCDMMALLCKPEDQLNAAIPSANPAKTLQGSEVVNVLRSLLSLLDEVKKERETLEAEIKSATFDMSTHFLLALAQDGTINEEVLSLAQLDQQYGQYNQRVQTTLRKQEELLAQVQTAHQEFSGLKQSNSEANNREEVLKKLASAHDSYVEISNNLSEGTKFYNGLTEILLKFQNKCSDIVFARKTERDELLKDLQQSIAREPSAPSFNVPAYQSNLVAAGAVSAPGAGPAPAPGGPTPAPRTVFQPQPPPQQPQEAKTQPPARPPPPTFNPQGLPSTPGGMPPGAAPPAGNPPPMVPPGQAQGPPYPAYQGYPGYHYQMPMGYNPYPIGYNLPYMPYQAQPGQQGYPGAPPAGQPYPGYPQQPPQQQPYYPQQ